LDQDTLELLMSTTYFSRTVVKGGQVGAAFRVRYLTRALRSEREDVQGRAQRTENHPAPPREDLVFWRARNMPSWAREDPATFFRAAEQYSSPAWIAYEAWTFSVPRELSHVEQIDAASDFLTSTFGQAHPYIWALHDPVAADGGAQPHVHVLWSARTLDGTPRTPAQFFRRYNAAHPERGGAQNARELGHFGAVKAARVHYTDIMNLHLERAGSGARLHPDRFETRGIVRTPEPRLSPVDSQALKRGETTDAMQDVLAHRQHHGLAKRQEQRLALSDWEARKQTLGLTPDLDRARSVEQIREARVRTSRDVPGWEAEAPHASRQRAGPVRAGGVADGEGTMRLVIPLVGNRDTKIVHAPGDPHYGVVHPRNQVLFWSMAEAEAAGYRAAINQHYGRGAVQRREEDGDDASDSATATRQSLWRHGAHSMDRHLALPRTVQEPEGPHGHAPRVRIFDEERRRSYGR
jgi:hypothetical protein